jgi:uncharacterized membrane protein
MVGALYVVLTVGLGELSFLAVQFRLAEILNLAAFIDPLYGAGVVVGCFVANLTSPFGMLDVLVGTAATGVAVWLIRRVRPLGLFAASLCPVLVNGILIGAEINFFENVPFGPLYAVNPLLVMAGEFAVVCCVGYPVFRFLLLNPALAARFHIKK